MPAIFPVAIFFFRAFSLLSSAMDVVQEATIASVPVPPWMLTVVKSCYFFSPWWILRVSFLDLFLFTLAFAGGSAMMYFKELIVRDSVLLFEMSGNRQPKISWVSFIGD